MLHLMWLVMLQVQSLMCLKHVCFRNYHPVRPQADRGISTYVPVRRFMKAVLDMSRCTSYNMCVSVH